jgi:cytochrome P450
MARPIPGPRGLPILGDPKMFDETSINYIISLIAQYGNIFSVDFGPRRLIYLVGPKYLQYVLADNVSNFLNHPVGELMGGPIYGDGVLFLDAASHKQARRMMQPAFHKKRVESYVEVMIATTAALLATWKDQIVINRQMHELTLQIVARVLLNLDITHDSSDLSHAWDQIMGHNGDMLGVILARVPFSERRRGTQIMDDLIARLIAERRAKGSDEGDVLSMLLDARDEDGSAFDDRQIRDHLFILLLAGHETSANGLTWAFYLLAQHPGWAKRLVNEIKTTLGDRVPTYADLESMPTLDMVVRETLRIMPPVAGFLREIATDCELDDYLLPGGALVFYSILGTHLLPDLYPDPYCFKPERFAPDAPRRYSPYEYLPFGAGSRLCLGQPMAVLEMKTILTLTLQKYRLDLLPDQQIDVIFRGTLTPRQDIKMRVSPQDGQTERSPAPVSGSITKFISVPTPVA